MRTGESQNGMSEYIVKKAATARRSATAPNTMLAYVSFLSDFLLIVLVIRQLTEDEHQKNNGNACRYNNN